MAYTDTYTVIHYNNHFTMLGLGRYCSCLSGFCLLFEKSGKIIYNSASPKRVDILFFSPNFSGEENIKVITIVGSFFLFILFLIIVFSAF